LTILFLQDHFQSGGAARAAGRWEVVRGRRPEDGGRRSVGGEQWAVFGGQKSVIGSREAGGGLRGD